MPPLVLSCAEVREREARVYRLGLTSLVLMENAGQGAARLLLSLATPRRVVVLCGKGNNGGDGLVLARHLDNQRIPVQVILFANPDELTPDATVQYRVLTGSGVAVEVRPTPDLAQLRAELATADWIVDALFGAGLKGPLRPPFDAIVSLINEATAKVLALDIPTGLDGDSGQPLGPTVRADHTGTFIALKSGFLRAEARPWLGAVHLIEIGLPRRFLE